MNNDTFDRFYNEFKDWSKKDILRRTYNIILDDVDKTRQIERLKELVPYKALTPDADEIIEELNRLNNIINGLEKYLIEMSDRSWDDNGAYDDALDKLKSLKEDNNNV